VRAAPVLQAAWAGAARRLVQSLVVFAVLAVSSAAAVTGLSLALAANAGYAAGLAVTHAADLAVTINASKVRTAQLAATRHLPGVTQDAGPYPDTTITVAAGGGDGGLPPTKLTVVGRGSPSGPLDDVVANPPEMAPRTHGQSRWPARPGEISVSTSTTIRLPLGASLNTAIHKINYSAIHGQGQLQTAFPGQASAFTPSQADAVQAAIRAQPGTLHYVAETDLQYFSGLGGLARQPGSPASKVNVGVAGRPEVPLMTYVYGGDSSWLGWSLVSGRWYNGPGQVDVSTAFVADTRRTTGDSATLTVNGKPVAVRIAGEVFIPSPVPAVWVSR
jgi:hypothetical protein